MDRPYSEAIERAALADIHAAATPRIAAELQLNLIQAAGALVSIAGELPASAIVINRALGIGLNAPATKHELQDIVAAYEQAGVSRYFVQKHPDAEPANLSKWIHDAGLAKARGWQKFSRGADPAPKVSSDLRIESVGAERGKDFARIVCDAFDLGEAARPWLALLPGRPEWHVFMSFDGNATAGTGALFVRDGIAWSDFGATAPAYRRRGSQGALLARRIDHAASLGCRRIFTCTGEDVAGDPQHSYRNILKMGFETEYVRENYAPA
jgi:GNAT superfamily N-acetyltransferase